MKQSLFFSSLLLGASALTVANGENVTRGADGTYTATYTNYITSITDCGCGVTGTYKPTSTSTSWTSSASSTTTSWTSSSNSVDGTSTSTSSATSSDSSSSSSLTSTGSSSSSSSSSSISSTVTVSAITTSLSSSSATSSTLSSTINGSSSSKVTSATELATSTSLTSTVSGTTSSGVISLTSRSVTIGTTSSSSVTSTSTSISSTVSGKASSSSSGAATSSTLSSSSKSSSSSSVTIALTTTTASTTAATTTKASTTSSSGSGAVVTDQAYIDTILRHHNVHRANHSAPALEWSAKLAETARKIGETCVWGHNTEMDGGGYGQNIGVGFVSTAMGAFVTESLYNGEVNFYKSFGKEPSGDEASKAGHFTAIVWKGTTSVGCYTADCSKTGLTNLNNPLIPSFFTVCNYAPTGNVGGLYAANVLASQGAASLTASYKCNSAANCVGDTF